MSISYRYLESGYCTDLLPKMVEILKPLYPHIRASNFLPWKVYTTKDQELYRKRFPTNTGNQFHKLKSLIPGIWIPCAIIFAIIPHEEV